MKKLLLFLLCLSCWTQTFPQSEINLTPEQEEEAWEILIQQFFPKGMEDFFHPERFYDDISYHIVNPTKNDSLALQMLIDQIDPLIPQSVFYSKTKEEANFIMEINTLNDSIKTLGNFRLYPKDFEIGNKSGYFNNEIIFQHLSLEAQNRPKAIRTWALIGLIRADLTRSRRPPQGQYSSQSILIYPHFNQQVIDDNSYYKITDLDKFLLKKLYSKDLDEQVRDFIIGEYGYWTWLNFLFPEDILQTLRLISFVFLAILLASLLYWPITRLKLNYGLVNYILQGVILSCTTFPLFLFYSYLEVQPDTNVLLGETLEHVDWKLSFGVMIWISLIATLFSSFLFLLDYFFLSRFSNLFSRCLARTANFALATLAAGLSILVVTQDFSSKPISMILFGCIGLLTFGVARSVFFYFKEKNENLIVEKDLQLSYLAASKAEAEVASLHARINPHFLYNSLNSIAALAHVDSGKTEKMALSLSDLFRHNLNRKNEHFCTIQEEIEAIKAYLEIEQIRFGDRLDYKIEVDETLQQYLIPRNIIQPLVENAIKHGISKMKKEGRIKLQVLQKGKEIEISVVDNGPKFTEGIISGYGLQSIFDILNLTYKDKAELSWENEPEKRIWISIDKAELKLRKNGI